MTVYLIGCTHFGHENIIKLANRPFHSVEEMDEVLIENWNRVVKATDTVYHLGDFAFRGAPAESYEAKLNGKILKVQGNHDARDWGVHYDTVKANRTRSHLFHYPIEEWDGWWKGSLHFHCHTHKPNFKSAERRGNVGADAIDFTPIRLEDAMGKLLD